MNFMICSGQNVDAILGVRRLLCVSALGVLRQQIQSGLDRWFRTTQAFHPHPRDDVAALLDYMQSETHSLRERGAAVWALGRARDPRAQPVTESERSTAEVASRPYECPGGPNRE